MTPLLQPALDLLDPSPFDDEVLVRRLDTHRRGLTEGVDVVGFEVGVQLML
jgi:hypothetical protein